MRAAAPRTSTAPADATWQTVPMRDLAPGDHVCITRTLGGDLLAPERITEVYVATVVRNAPGQFVRLRTHDPRALPEFRESVHTYQHMSTCHRRIR